jgi:hypothetical protein
MPHVIYCDRCARVLVSRPGLCATCKAEALRKQRPDNEYKRLTTKPRSPRDTERDTK